MMPLYGVDQRYSLKYVAENENKKVCTGWQRSVFQAHQINEMRIRQFLDFLKMKTALMTTATVTKHMKIKEKQIRPKA